MTVLLEDFYRDFMARTKSYTQIKQSTPEQVFFELMSGYLIDTGDLSDNTTASFYESKGITIHGYDFDDERKDTYKLIVCHYDEKPNEVSTLLQDAINKKFKAVKDFFHEFADKNANLEALKDNSLAYDLAKDLQDKVSHLKSIQLYLFTNTKLSQRLKPIDSTQESGIEFIYKIFGLEEAHKIYQANMTSDIAIDLSRENIACIPVETGTEDYQSYLFALPARVLYDIYKNHGKRLLESNVRGFLQFRGNVNKGLRNTMIERPHMFFAFNNGLTATAKDVTISDDNTIQAIEGLQIVNGGQTTVAIFRAYREDRQQRIDLDNITVQVKLSVVADSTVQEKFISDVCEYANTQNSVRPSDFFSNSPFQKDFKTHSQQVIPPLKQGEQTRTHWFYERVRMEYPAQLKEEEDKSPKDARDFEKRHPRHQIIDKIELSRALNAWDCKPDIACSGGQKSFSVFAYNTTQALEKDEHAITEVYFKHTISKIILWRETGLIMKNSPWYRDRVVPPSIMISYALAYLAHLCKQKKKELDFDRIWQQQGLPADIHSLMGSITSVLHQYFSDYDDPATRLNNWAKKPACWDNIVDKDNPLPLPQDKLSLLDKVLRDIQDSHYEKRQAKKAQKELSGIQIQTFIVELQADDLKKLYDYYKTNRQGVSPRAFDILQKYATGRLAGIPTERQAKQIYDLYKKAKDEGIQFKKS